MDPHLNRNDGQIRLGNLLDAAGLRQSDLPTLPPIVSVLEQHIGPVYVPLLLISEGRRTPWTQ